MKNKDIYALLLRDQFNRKSFDAKWDAECSECGNMIEEGDTFYFMGDKEKICVDCHDQILGFLEEEKEKG